MEEVGATKSDQPKRVSTLTKGRMLVPQSFTAGRQNPQWNGRIGLDQVVTGKIVSKEASSNAKTSFEFCLGGVSPAIWRYRGV